MCAHELGGERELTLFITCVCALSYCMHTHFTHVREIHIQVIIYKGPRMPHPGLLESNFQL